MASPLAYKYIVVPLPSPISQDAPPENLSSIAKRYSELRLAILLSSPTSFASSHAVESTFTQEQWEQRVWRDGVTVFVCVARPTVEETMEVLEDLDGEWVGATTVFGPVTKNNYELAPESGSPEVGADDQEIKWQMTALFTSPEHRGRGLAKRLIEGAKAYTRVRTRTLSKTSKGFRMRIMVHPKNLVVVKLYSGLGFVDVGRATGREAFVANGDEALIAVKMAGPEEGKVMLTHRSALVMEYLERLED